MKKTIALFLLSTLVLGCKKTLIDPINRPTTIDLGVAAASTSIIAVYPLVSNGVSVSIVCHVTQGAKYSLQVEDLDGNTIKTFGFAPDTERFNKSINLASLKDGDYSLVLLDIAGNQSKSNIVIKH